MQPSADWTIEYYVEDGGRIPVRELLLGLDAKTYARFQWSLDQLVIRNVQAGYPLVRHVESKLWGTTRGEPNQHFSVYTGRRIVLLHGLAKKTQRLQRTDIETALRRLTRFEERERGG